MDIHDNSELIVHFKRPEHSYDSRMRIALEKKDGMKKRGLSFPDVGDALAVTFAEPVASHQVQDAFGDYADAVEGDGFVSGGEVAQCLSLASLPRIMLP